MRFLALFIVGSFASTLLAQPLVIREWFRTVDGGFNQHDHAYRVVLGSHDQPIIAGERTAAQPGYGAQTTVLGFLPNGQMSWSRFVVRNSGWKGTFANLVTDHHGNVLVTGSMGYIREENGGGMITEKLDPTTGTPLWNTHYISPRGINGDALALYSAVAQNDDALMVGFSHQNRDWVDLTALRLDGRDGRVKWLSHYAPYYNSATHGRAIGELPNGEVFTANQHSIGVGEQDGLAIWHDGQTGEIRRLYLYDSGCRDAFGTRLAIDAQGNAYTGEMGCYQDDDGQWYWAPLIWKWAPNGQLVWTRGLNFGRGGLMGGLRLDGRGALFALRTIQDSEDRWTNVVVKIDAATGRFIWISAMPPYSDLADLAIDSAGDVYAAGWTLESQQGASPFDGLLYKIRGIDGQPLWKQTFHHGSVHGGADRFYDVAVDRHGNVYACGSASVTNNLADFLLVKYRQPIRGDVNLDGCVDDQDLALQLEAFGTFDARYDSNGDGFVDMADVLLLLDHFGEGCE